MNAIRAGINGHHHNKGSIKHYGPVNWQSTHRPLPFGVAYLGDGRWMLPIGAEIEPTEGENWLLTMPDGKVFHVWAER